MMRAMSVAAAAARVEAVRPAEVVDEVLAAARGWRDARRDRVSGMTFHRACDRLAAAVDALDEAAPAPARPDGVPDSVWWCAGCQRVVPSGLSPEGHTSRLPCAGPVHLVRLEVAHGGR